MQSHAQGGPISSPPRSVTSVTYPPWSPQQHRYPQALPHPNVGPQALPHLNVGMKPPGPGVALAPEPDTCLRFVSGSASRQHPIKRDMGMIDADAVEETPTLLAVCDGVSEVQKMGIPPHELPRDLLNRVRECLEADVGWHHESADCHRLVGLLEESYSQTTAMGSTTVLFATIESDGCHQLSIANLGDCRCLLLRPDKDQNLEIAFKTEPLRYDVNKPKQITRLDGVNIQLVHRAIRETKVDTMAARHGDLLVLGSDGLFDNLHDEEVVRLVEGHCLRAPVVELVAHHESRPSLDPPSVAQLEEAAEALVAEALNRVCVGQMDESGRVQWPEDARPTPVGMGGKADDTTAIVACVVEVADPEAHEEIYYETRAATRSRASWGNGLLPRCCGMESEEGGLSRRRTPKDNDEPGCSVS